MWIARRWRTISGAIGFFPSLCVTFWHAVGHAGDVDFFLAHIRDWGWAGDMIAWLLNPPVWSLLPMILVGLFLIGWDARRYISKLRRAEQSAEDRPIATKQAAVATVEQPKPRSKSLKLLPVAPANGTDHSGGVEELPDWQVLFALQDDGTIRLKIYPDTPHVMRDSFCLVLFAYGLLKGMDEVPKSLIEPEMRRLMSNAPTNPVQKALSVDHALRAWFVNDFGQSAYEAGRIERVGLSTGIRYKLLWPARDDCFHQARDLIRRA